MAGDIPDNTRHSLQAELCRLLRGMVPEVPDAPQHNAIIDSLAHGNDPVLRAWNNGKYKCPSLRRFITAYSRIADGLNTRIILDYILQDTGKPYTVNTIQRALSVYGPGRRFT